jgi:hypothetical protein
MNISQKSCIHFFSSVGTKFSSWFTTRRSNDKWIFLNIILFNYFAQFQQSLAVDSLIEDQMTNEHVSSDFCSLLSSVWTKFSSWFTGRRSDAKWRFFIKFLFTSFPQFEQSLAIDSLIEDQMTNEHFSWELCSHLLLIRTKFNSWFTDRRLNDKWIFLNIILFTYFAQFQKSLAVDSLIEDQMINEYFSPDFCSIILLSLNKVQQLILWSKFKWQMNISHKSSVNLFCLLAGILATWSTINDDVSLELLELHVASCIRFSHLLW